MFDNDENLYGFYRLCEEEDSKFEDEYIQEEETGAIKGVKVEVFTVDELRESRNQKDYVFCKVEYDNQNYWFQAYTYGAAIVELYLMLRRPKDFMRKLGTISEYYMAHATHDVLYKRGEMPEIYQASRLTGRVLEHVNEWNRDLCALAITSMDEKIHTEQDLRDLQAQLLPNIEGMTILNEDFSRASVQHIRNACPVVCSYLFLEENNCSFDFMCFYGRCMKLKDKTEFLFWIFIYESCVGDTRLPYLLYKAILENQFAIYANGYASKREYFKDWNKRWMQ